METRDGTDAGLYLRISEDRTEEGLGVERQRRDARRIAKAEGLRIVEEFVDNDISAWNGKRRVGFERLLTELEAGRFTSVAVWAVDRMCRTLEDQLRLMRAVQAAGGVIVTAKDGVLDPTSAEGEMRMSMLATFAAFESRRKSERQRAKHRELAEAGRPSGGGDRAFGYEADKITVIPSEADLIREAARHVLAGGSLRSLKNGWNANGITTTTGRPWSVVSMRRVLISPRIAGLRELRGARTRAVWDPIISTEDHERLVAILTDPVRRTNKGANARRYLLSGGMLRCGRCDAAMVARPNDRGDRRYACSKDHGGCGRTFHIADSLEAYVADVALDALSVRDLARQRRAQASADSTERQIGAELAQITEDRRDLADRVAAGRVSLDFGEMTDQRYLARAADLQAKLSAIDAGSATADLPIGLDDLVEVWEAADLDRRRAILPHVIERIVILPAKRGYNRFDPGRVEIVPRDHRGRPRRRNAIAS